MTKFKMLLLFFLHLIKCSQRNFNMPHYDYIFFCFSLISLLIFALCIFVSFFFKNYRMEPRLEED